MKRKTVNIELNTDLTNTDLALWYKLNLPYHTVALQVQANVIKAERSSATAKAVRKQRIKF
jgi:hypothetical protein